MFFGDCLMKVVIIKYTKNGYQSKLIIRYSLQVLHLCMLFLTYENVVMKKGRKENKYSMFNSVSFFFYTVPQ